MNKSLITFFVVLLGAALAAWWAPGATVQPGRLLPAHASLTNACLACHTPLKGVSGAKCQQCHALAEIGLRDSHGRALDAPRRAVQALHQRNQDHGCTECHAEHAGRLGAEAAARFTHEGLSEGIARDCAACHGGQEPADALHSKSGMACGDCHTVEAWTPATFDHGSLSGGGRCSSCHLKDQPGDELHRGLANDGDCASCHGTRAWTPATYDHGRFFRFDGHHPAHCADCHTPGQGYQRYTCTGCHAHSPGRLAAEHREEGIANWQDCVRCHRSGNEDEAGGEGGEGGGHGGREEEEGEDDD